MYLAQTIKSPSLSPYFLKQGLFALMALSLIMLLPDIAFAADETGEEVTTKILEAIVKYSKWIAFAVIGIAFIMVGWFCLRAYGSWADEDNKQGTLPRLVLTVFLGILILAVVTIFVTKGVGYLETNIVTTSISPTYETTIA